MIKLKVAMIRKNKMLIFGLFVIVLTSQVFMQDIPKMSSQKYYNDEEGNILMYVNVWGHVNNPGVHLVYEGIDLATLIAFVGGPKRGANLKNVKIYREEKIDNEESSFVINLESFFKNGSRDDFVKIKPNDTIIFEQTSWSSFVDNAGTLNTLLSIVNLYFLIEYNKDQ